MLREKDQNEFHKYEMQQLWILLAVNRCWFFSNEKIFAIHATVNQSKDSWLLTISVISNESDVAQLHTFLQLF